MYPVYHGSIRVLYIYFADYVKEIHRPGYKLHVIHSSDAWASLHHGEEGGNWDFVLSASQELLSHCTAMCDLCNLCLKIVHSSAIPLISEDVFKIVFATFR